MLDIFLKNGELNALDSEAQNLLENQRTFFQNILVNTNTDGGGYSTNGVSREDENHDDDDFHGEIFDTDGIPDNDGTAFMFKFGFIPADKEENVLFINKKYTDVTWFTANSLSGLNVTLDQNADCTIEVYDGSIYKESGEFVLKSKKIFPLQSSKNFVPIASAEVNPDDIILVFLSNHTHDMISYSIGWVDLQGGDIIKFMPANNADRNVDFYANLILKDKNGKYIAYENMFYNVLSQGKKPVSPTYLHMKSLTGTTLELEWDINDRTNTWAYYLYRGIDSLVDCKEQCFLLKLPDGYKENTVSIEYTPGTYYYTLCGSNAVWSWSGLINVGNLSLKSNILQVNN